MPLPQNGAMWPPQQLRRAYETFEELDAWYTGDQDALGWLYSAASPKLKTSMWGQAKRRFWGTPNPLGTSQRPVKMHVGAASEVSRMSSQILFGQMPAVHFGDMDGDDDDKGLTAAQGEEATARLNEILDDAAHATILEGGEYASAHGGTYLRVVWDKDVVADKPFLGTVASDAAVPTFRHDRLVDVTFWSQLAPISGSNGVYKLLELHSRGRIEWGLYQSSSINTLGTLVPLTEHPDTTYLADVVDQNAGVDTGSNLLTAVYVPNLKPNGAWRKDPGASSLGRSDFADAIDLFDDLDETYTSLQRDFRLGKARAVVPKGFMKVGAPGQSATFNADQEFFVEAGEQVGSLNINAPSGTSAGSTITFMQPSIRTKDHLDKIIHITARIYQACGFSPQSFGDAGETAITATEVNAREKLTMLTRQAKLLYWRPALSALFAALMDVDEFIFAGPGRGKALPAIEFADAAAQDPKILADTLQALNTSEATSIRTRVAMLHEDWSGDQINAEVDQIKIDYSMLPDPTMKNLWAATAGNGSITGGVAPPSPNDPDGGELNGDDSAGE